MESLWESLPAKERMDTWEGGWPQAIPGRVRVPPGREPHLAPTS